RGVLLFLPVLAFGIYGAIAAGAGFAMIRWLKTFENATDYSIMNSGKQMLWLPTTREEKYRAKQAIDTAFVRFGDVLATVVVITAMSLHLPLAALATVNVVLTVLWIGVAWAVARRHQLLAGEKDVLAKRAANALGRVVGARPDYRRNALISFLIL